MLTGPFRMSAERDELPVEPRGGSDVGARLREARERRGLTIQALSGVTKVKAATLDAIERNDIGRLPGGPYTRGHVYAYAAEVGLSPNEIAAEYMAQFKAPEEPQLPPPVARDRRPLAIVAMAGVVVACGIGLLVYAFFRFSEEATEPLPVAVAPAAVTTAIGTQGTEGTESAQAPGASEATITQAAPDSRPLRLEVMPSGPCWVSIRADGELAIFRVMRAGEREVVEADESIVANVGDAGAFVYRINGVTGRPLGGPGAVVTVRITESTFRSFLTDVTAQNN